MSPPNTSEHIRLQQHKAVLSIVLNRPQSKNAINLAMYTDMTSAIEFAASHHAIRVVTIHGEGECFTSGNDLNDFMQSVQLDGEGNPIFRFIKAVLAFNKPIIAAVEGVAYGIGTTMLLHCDRVFASPGATFCLPFINLGLVPEFAASQLLPQRVGYMKANQWLSGGEPFSASEAYEHGLINGLVDHPVEEARLAAQALAAKPPKALQATKTLLKQYAQGDLLPVVEAEVKAFSAALSSPEFAEAAAAFFEKRPAKFE